jgi:hypothetical protein
MNFSPFVYSELSEYTPYKIQDNGEARVLKRTSGSDHFDGFGCGTSKSAICAATGEFLERRQFFREDSRIKTFSQKKILELLSPKWTHCFTQLTHHKESLISGKTNCYPVMNLFTGEKAYLPRAVITLKAISTKERESYGIIDSCGNSFHTKLEKGVENSIKEFAERQCLILSWLDNETYEHCELTAKMVKKYNLDNKLYGLLKKGTIKVARISRLFKTHVTLAKFISKDNPDGVYFSIGASGSFCPRLGFAKALEELIGSYLYTQSQQNKKDLILDEYKKFYIQCNQYEIGKSFPAFKGPSVKDIDSWFQLKEVTLEEEIRNLKTFTNELYLYTATLKDQKSRSLGFGLRILSPSFYMHMKTDGPLNFINDFSRAFNVDFEFKKRMPFP